MGDFALAKIAAETDQGRNRGRVRPAGVLSNAGAIDASRRPQTCIRPIDLSFNH